MRRASFPLFLLLFIVALPLHAQDNTTLRVGHYFLTADFDPHGQGNRPELIYYEPVFDALLTLDAEGNLLPNLATEWTTTPESMTFTLRADVVFSDGTPFDAETAAANLNRARTEGSSLVREDLSAIDDIEVVDEVTIRLLLNRDDPFLLRRLAGFAGMMISPGTFETAGQMPVGTGPFMLDREASVFGSLITYVRNPLYRDPDAITLEVIEYRIGNPVDGANALLGGEYDLVILPARLTALLGGEDVNIRVVDTSIYAVNILDREGTLVPELGNQDVRCALSHAVDREAYAQVTGGAALRPLDTITPPGWYGHAGDAVTYPYDPERARELLASAGVTNLTIPSVTSPALQTRHEAVTGFFTTLGITIDTAVTTDATVVAEFYGGDYALIEFNANPEHFSLFVQEYILADGPFNAFGAVDEDIEALAAEALALPLDEAEPLWQEISRLVNERCYFIPLGVGGLAIVSQPYVEAETRFRSNGFLYLRNAELNR
ncbi:MAG: hypothetical protein GYB67_07290 [Chloroflexi bacterium]|nr:hypothetical protein [Chloroflexota bacterium]